MEYKDGVLRPSGVGVSFGYTTSPRCVEMVASKGMKFKGETRTEKELEHFVRGAVGPSIYVGWRMEDDTAFGTTLNRECGDTGLFNALTIVVVNHFVATYQQVWDPPKSQLSLTPPPRC